MLGKPFSIRDTLLLTIGTLTLLIVMVASYETFQAWKRLRDAEMLKEATILGSALFKAAERFSEERGLASIMLLSSDETQMSELAEQMQKSRRQVEQELNIMLHMLRDYEYEDVQREKEKLKAQLQQVHSLRKKIDEAIALPAEQVDKALVDEWFDTSTEFVQQLHLLRLEFKRHFIGMDPAVTQHMMFKHFLGMVTEYAGRERAMIGQLIVSDKRLTLAQQEQLLQWRGVINMGWYMCRLFARHGGLYPLLEPYIAEAESHYFENFDMMRDVFYQPGVLYQGEYPISAALWFELATQAIDSLYRLNDASLEETRRFTEVIAEKARRMIFVHMGLLLAALVLCFYSFQVILYRVLRPIHGMVEALYGAVQGKEVPSVPHTINQEDEVGKLAEVLYAFQRKVEEVKRATEELQHYVAALERSNKELDDFAYIASHDLKEPLRGIHNHSCFLLEDNEKILDEESAKRLHRLVYLSQRMEQLVNDLLYFSRLGRHELALRETDVNTLIHDIEDTIDHFIKEHNGRIVLPKPLPTITCDAVRVTEVFRNLITNAMKYNDNEEKRVEIGWLESAKDRSGEPVAEVFYVKDNGKGIAPEFHEEVFRIFRRLHANKEKAEGTGVGLTFVKKIIERHGGHIWLESEPGKGSTFYFTLGGKE